MEEIKKDIYATSGVWNLDQVMIYPVSSRMEYDVLFVTRTLTRVVHDGVSQGTSGRGVVSGEDGQVCTGSSFSSSNRHSRKHKSTEPSWVLG